MEGLPAFRVFSPNTASETEVFGVSSHEDTLVMVLPLLVHSLTWKIPKHQLESNSSPRSLSVQTTHPSHAVYAGLGG